MKETTTALLAHPLAKPLLAFLTIGGAGSYCLSLALATLQKVQGS